MEELNFEWALLTPEYILVAWAGAIVLLSLFSDRIGKVQLGYLAAAGALVHDRVAGEIIGGRRVHVRAAHRGDRRRP